MAWVEKHIRQVCNGSIKALCTAVTAIREWMGFCRVTLFTWQMNKYLWVHQENHVAHIKQKTNFIA